MSMSTKRQVATMAPRGSYRECARRRAAGRWRRAPCCIALRPSRPPMRGLDWPSTLAPGRGAADMAGEVQADTTTDHPHDRFRISAPQVALPKGGGAIRGIGEKFAANPVTGTASLSVPIATSPGRAGFGPELALSYDSGAGNGPFGLGWSLSLPSITRKTEKGLPRYDAAQTPDVFVLTRAEDLVPVLEK